jgi:ABC-type transport system involved in multi-copper enzyme maturation permease subunit
VRDYRVQLRGNRAILLWSFYLLVLIGFTMLVYSGSAAGEQRSIVEAQSQLRTFYQSIMILMAVMISLISPALTAGSIVMERQRRSLDLVFSAPVTTKYYLVGKMMSSYRYIWMLLVLSLPVTSACVVLGGATWSDVLAAYIILSFNALVYTAIALLFSSLSRLPVAAVVWSYAATTSYSILTGMLAASGAISSLGRVGRSLAAPFTMTLNPYSVVQAAPTFTTLYGYDVPNWVLGLVFSLLLTKLLLLAAGSAMSPFGSAETKSLRIHGLVYAFIFCGLVAYASSPAISAIRSVASSASGTRAAWSAATDIAYGWLLVPLFALMPFIACYGSDSERKYWQDGVVNIKNTFLGTPSGGLPYLVLMVMSAYAGYAFVHSELGTVPPSLEVLWWTIGFWTFMWSLGRFASSFNLGLRASRSLHFTLMMALVALPVPFLGALGAFSDTNQGLWDLYIMRPIIKDVDNRMICLIYGTLMLAGGILTTFVAETIASRKGVLQRYAA